MTEDARPPPPLSSREARGITCSGGYSGGKEGEKKGDMLCVFTPSYFTACASHRKDQRGKKGRGGVQHEKAGEARGKAIHHVSD